MLASATSPPEAAQRRAEAGVLADLTSLESTTGLWRLLALAQRGYQTAERRSLR